MYGFDVKSASDYLVKLGYLKSSQVSKNTSGYVLYDNAMIEAVKSYEKDKGFTVDGQISKTTGISLVTDAVSYHELGSRDLTVGMSGTDVAQMKNLLIEKFGAVLQDGENDFEETNISSSVSDQMQKDAIIAVVLATICMLIYIWLRFKNLRFAGSAVIALIHDVLVVLGFYAVSRTTVGTTFIACMLTIVGYSINATIVIFDRIRENLAEKANARDVDLKQVVNDSITQTLTRSIYTSFTTFVMVAVLYVLGVASIREFALPIMVGIIAGGYSSVFITGSLWYMLSKNKYGKKTDDKATEKKADNKKAAKKKTK